MRNAIALRRTDDLGIGTPKRKGVLYVRTIEFDGLPVFRWHVREIQIRRTRVPE